MHSQRFPGESDEYRAARDALLHEELELRRRMEEIAVQRRQLPLGGVVPEDYAFEEGASDLGDRDTVRTVRMSELFGGHDTLILYNFMYGPKAAKPCPMCSSFIDGIHGNARHLAQRAGIAIVARSPIQRIRDFARERGWTQFRLLSSGASTFNRDYFGEEPDGDQNPMLHVFVKRGAEMRHSWSSELQFLAAEPGQNQRHLDTMWPLWNVLDMTPGGRGDWYPPL